MGNEQHSLATYVSDMLALERHIRVPFETQSKDKDIASDAGAGPLVAEMLQVCDDHVERLDRCLETLGGHELSPVKSAVTQIEGAVAGAIDKMRKTKVSKSLRDDYTALALCSAGYSALLATATAMHDETVAALAESCLQDYAHLVMRIGETLPTVVVRELADIGLDVDPLVGETARQRVSRSWSAGARDVRAAQQPGSSYGTVDTPTRSSSIP